MIKDAIRIAEIHLERLSQSAKEIEGIGNLEELDLKDFEDVKTIDTFVFRFMKLQDYMGNRLFKAFLIEIGDYTDDMSFIDVLDKLEKLEIINSVEDWLKLRKLRNKLAHEYPDELDEILEDIREALKWLPELKDTYSKIKNYLLTKGLLE